VADYPLRAESGYLNKVGPSIATAIAATPGVNTADTFIPIGQQHAGSYYIYRGYLSFDTSSIPADAEIVSARLNYALVYDASTTDIDINLYYATQPTWGGTLAAADWGSGTTGPTLVRNTSGASLNTWYTADIPVASINKGGLTEFELRSSPEGVDTTSDRFAEIGSSRHATYKPYLTVELAAADDSMDQDGACVVLIYV
jgi:hypothetical protein